MAGSQTSVTSLLNGVNRRQALLSEVGQITICNAFTPESWAWLVLPYGVQTFW